MPVWDVIDNINSHNCCEPLSFPASMEHVNRAAAEVHTQRLTCTRQSKSEAPCLKGTRSAGPLPHATSKHVRPGVHLCRAPNECGPQIWTKDIRSICKLRIRQPRISESKFTGTSLWAWEFRPSKSIICLSQGPEFLDS